MKRVFPIVVILLCALAGFAIGRINDPGSVSVIGNPGLGGCPLCGLIPLCRKCVDDECEWVYNGFFICDYLRDGYCSNDVSGRCRSW